MADTPPPWSSPDEQPEAPPTPPTPAAPPPGRATPATPPAPSWGGPTPAWGHPAAPQPWGWPAPAEWGAPAGPPTGWSPPPGRGPGIVPLRPLTIGEIYDGAIRAIRSNPRTMVGFSAIVVSLLTLLATVPQAYFVSALLNSPLTTDPEAAENPEFADVAGLIGAGGIAVLVGVLQYVVA